MKQVIADNLARVQERIATACGRAGRSPAEVRLVAVTKYVGVDAVAALLQLGVHDIGESRVQELIRKATGLPHRAGDPQAPRWHLVGHLQRNKVKAVLPLAALIHSVDSLRLAEEIETQSERAEVVTPVLLEVNPSGEASKFGVSVPAALPLAEQIVTLPHVSLRGLMAMGPLAGGEAATRRAFERVRELYDEMRAEGIGGADFRELSLGMSGDFELGIETGATIVRIGSALFEGLPQTHAEPHEHEPAR